MRLEELPIGFEYSTTLARVVIIEGAFPGAIQAGAFPILPTPVSDTP